MNKEEIKQKILDHLYQYGETCTNCGLGAGSIAKAVGLHYGEIAPYLNDLYVEERITVRSSPYGRLIFLNYNKYEKVQSST